MNSTAEELEKWLAAFEGSVGALAVASGSISNCKTAKVYALIFQIGGIIIFIRKPPSI